MAELKSLAKDTAIYGASSIIGKFLNYFLVPIYTFSLPAAFRRIWSDHQDVCYCGVIARSANLRNGNRLFPFCQ